MQSQVLKFIPFALLLLFVAGSDTQAQSLNYHLSKADSLFRQKRYTQSLELYQSIFNQKQYTPAMLLKMAYMEEGLDHTATSLYYLNLYYLSTKDEQVLTKISEVATKYGLDGYDFSETERVLARYDEHRMVITATVGSVIIFLLSLMVFQHSRKAKPVGTWIVLVFFLILLFIHENVRWSPVTAIISKPDTYVMSGPSAGASVLRIISEGHRVEITGKEDVWVRVRINNRMGYVKADNLLPVSL